MSGFEKLCEIVARLRAPGGCPWDREQTHESLLPGLIEEAYEVAGAVRADDNEEALSVRLAAYANQTKPLTDYYAAKGLLKTIDASLPVDRVTAALVEAIK